MSRKLKDQYGQAFLELTSDMGMTFDPASGIATVKPRIAAKAGLGPYTVDVSVIVVLIMTRGSATIMRFGESMKPAGRQRCPALRSLLWLTIDPKDSGPIA